MSEITDDLANLEAFEPDYKRGCQVCGSKPVVSATGLCGPCTFGEADTVNGGWWDKDHQDRLDELRAKEQST